MRDPQSRSHEGLPYPHRLLTFNNPAVLFERTSVRFTHGRAKKRHHKRHLNQENYSAEAVLFADVETSRRAREVVALLLQRAVLLIAMPGRSVTNIACQQQLRFVA